MERVLLKQMEEWLCVVVGRYQAGYWQGCFIAEHTIIKGWAGEDFCLFHWPGGIWPRA